MTPRDPWRDFDVDRFNIFVPAIMSAGLLFSVVTLLRDAVHDRRHRNRERRAAVAAEAVSHHVLTGEPAASALRWSVRPRVAYLLTFLSALGAAGYIVIGSVANYFQPDGYVGDIAWLLAVSIASATLFAGLAFAAGSLFLRWPDAPAWVAELLLATPLGQLPGTDQTRSQRRFLLGWMTTLTAFLYGIVSLAVGASRDFVDRLDERAADILAVAGWVESLAWADSVGKTEIAVGLALLVGVATLRCAPFAIAYLVSVIGALALTTVSRLVVDRPRPAGTTLTGLEDSYPSGHAVQVVLLAGLLSLAARVLTGRRWTEQVVGAVLAVTAVGTAVRRIDLGSHWASDVVGGILLGLTLVFGVRWFLERTELHARCHGCPWTAVEEPHPHGVFHLAPSLTRLFRRGAMAWTGLAIVGFAALAVSVGIPQDPEGDSLGRAVERPANLVLLALLAVGWVLEWRWPAIGATVFAAGGLALALLASVAHPPLVSLGIAVVFVTPAVLLWVSWQPDRSRRSVILLAAVTALSLVGVHAGASSVYDHFYGPAHPQSATPALTVDEVEWLWSGAVTSEGFEVRTAVEDDVARDELDLAVFDPWGRLVVRVPAEPVPGTEIVAFRVEGLTPATRYEVRVGIGDRYDEGRGRGSVRTFASGAQDLRFAVGSCARTGSNGQVFDAIRALEPDLYVITGDLHYGNPETGDPDRFRALFERVLTAPAQAALYRDVPVAYVWDDHDFGPNDSDSTSPTTETAWQVFREVVPSHASDAGPIYRAFTAGRVRFVITDTRSARTDETMLGTEQLRWFLDELKRSSQSHALVVWVNPTPWVTEADPSRDDWGGRADERAAITDFIQREGIDDLVMVSGDAHMVAMDDGTNTGGFPLLHAAPLDRPGNVKGGPYSEGTFTGAGQFGFVEVHDDGGAEVSVTLSGRDYTGQVLVERTFTFAAPAAGAG